MACNGIPGYHIKKIHIFAKTAILNNFSLLPLSCPKDIIHVTIMMDIYKLKN
jgi:hypothetical protein